MQIELKLVLLALGWVAYYFLHSFFASDRCKDWGRSRIGKYYRLSYNFWSVLALCPLLYWQWRLDAMPLWAESLLLQVIGVFLLLLGILLGFFALRAYDLGEFSGLAERWESDVPLVVNGLNAYVRHPLYCAMLLFLLGLGLIWPLDTVWLVVLVSIIYLFWGSSLEERKLIQRYGQAYVLYRRRVKRFIPYLL